MPSAQERMVVNAAIEQLIARNDDCDNAARIVIAYGSKLRCSKSFIFEYNTKANNSKESTSGYSPGHGEVTVQNEEREKHLEGGFGIYKDRVGHYRLWKDSEGLIKFHHFWKSGITTKNPEDDGPDEYHLGYDPKSTEPRYFGVARRQIIFSVWLGLTFKITRGYLDVIHGTLKKNHLYFGIGISSY